MAEIVPAILDQLRAMVGDTDIEKYQFADNEYATIYTARGEVNATAAYFWGIKASTFADLVDMSEAGSSRSQSQLYKNALEMQKYYTSQEPGGEGIPVVRKTHLRRIMRGKIDTL